MPIIEEVKDLGNGKLLVGGKVYTETTTERTTSGVVHKVEEVMPPEPSHPPPAHLLKGNKGGGAVRTSGPGTSSTAAAAGGGTVRTSGPGTASAAAAAGGAAGVQYNRGSDADVDGSSGLHRRLFTDAAQSESRRGTTDPEPCGCGQGQG